MFVIPLCTKNLKEDGFFYGYASVFNVVDHDGDVVVAGAFQKSLDAWESKKEKPLMLWQHEPAVVIGQWHDMSEDIYGLAVRGQIDLSHHAGQHVYHMMQAGDVKGLSIGFVPSNTLKRHGRRYLCEVDLREVSIVTEACNRMACVTQVLSKAAEATILSHF